MKIKRISYIIQFACFCLYGLMATIIQWLVLITNSTTEVAGFHLGWKLWLGFAFPLTMVHFVYNVRGKKLVVLIDLFYQFVYIIIQATLIGYFSAKS